MMFRLAENERRDLEAMTREKEIVSLLLGGDSSASASPIGKRVGSQSGYGPSSSSRNGFYYDDGLWHSNPFVEAKAKSHTPNTYCPNGLWLDPTPMVDDDELGLGLSDFFNAMHIGEQKNCTQVSQFGKGPNDGGFSDCSLGGGSGANLCKLDNHGSHEGFNNDVSGLIRCSPHGLAATSDAYMKLALLRLQEKQRASDLMRSLDYTRPNAPHASPTCYRTQLNSLLEQEQAMSSNHSSSHPRNISWSSPHLNASVGSQSIGDLDALISPQLMHLNLGRSHQPLPLNYENQLRHGLFLTDINRAIANTKVSQSPAYKKGVGALEGFSPEDSFVIQGKCSSPVFNKGHDTLRGYKKNVRNEIGMKSLSKLDRSAKYGRNYEHAQHPNSTRPLALPSFSSLAEIQGQIYLTAKDQNGCRYLQRVFDEGTHQEIQIIFNEIIQHAVELMTDQFGNYLMQKLLDVCNEDQRMKIVLMLTKELGDVARISSNPHGTRVIQKLIETLKTRPQITLIKSVLEPFFLALIKHQHGTHVIDRCLQCFSNGDNKFIFENAAKFCVDIATHDSGCVVLQRCIALSIGEDREKLVAEVSSNGLLLAQDPFGNYVVQLVIELKIPSAIANLIAQFEGNYVHLSMQKCSSHVVEKCLNYIEESKSSIVYELLSVSHFERLLQDPYANYVIQSALAVTKGALHASLLDAVRAHKMLRTSPYCKRIFSRNVFKK